MRSMSMAIALCALLLTGSVSPGAAPIYPMPAPAPAPKQNMVNQAKVWIRFADGTTYAGYITWFGPEGQPPNWNEVSVEILDNGVWRYVSRWWLVWATVTYR